MVECRGDDWKNYATHARFTSNPGKNIARFWPGGLKRLEMLLWHQRLGHPGHGALQRLTSSTFLPFNKVPTNSSICHACQLERHVRLPFSHSTTNTHHAFELIHCDLWTSPVESVFGYKYFLVILDDFTHYLWAFLLRQKSDVFSLLSNIRNHVDPILPLITSYSDGQWT
jgi:hypothetical protein